MLMDITRGILGVSIILGICYFMSNNRSKINWKMVINGILIQTIFAIFLLTSTDSILGFDLFSPIKFLINFLANGFTKLVGYTMVGAKMIFGPLADQVALQKIFPESGGFVFAFMALTNIIFVGAFMSVLYYLGIMQVIIKAMAKIIVKLMNASGAEAISCAANVFVGQTEAPLVVKPYIEKMTSSEILTLMVGGMATIAGGVMATYISILGGNDEALRVVVATRLLTASIMAAPAAILISKMMVPETEHSLTLGKVEIVIEKNASNVVEAAANGATDGVHLLINVAGMLLAFTALIAVVNAGASYLLTDLCGFYIGGKAVDLTILVGYVFSVFGLVAGIDLSINELVAFGSMLGQKVMLNEFVAYLTLSQTQALLAAKTVFISSFALCGFANFSSIAIQIGGIGSLAPNKKSEIAKFGIKAVIAGSLATLLTGTIAGMFFGFLN